MVIKDPENRAVARILSLTAFLATVMVLPLAGYDPINVPKLAVISTGGFMALGVMLANYSDLKQRQYRLVVAGGVAFVFHLTLVLIISGTNFNQEFFGTFGRSTGYVGYFALASLLIAATLSANISTLKLFSQTLVFAGLVSIVYGFIQALKLDPIGWMNPYSPVIGFLGNPNFQSSFVGFSGVMVFALLIHKGLNVVIRIGYIVYLIGAAYVIKETSSQQGFLVLLGGIAVVVFVWITKSSRTFLTIPSLVAGITGVVMVTLGSLNIGPLASILYKASVTYRGDYWRAGWNMTLESPFFGVGLDSYGDWYRRARTLEATLRRGPDVVSNAAHNVLLDFSSNGGFPLLFIYLSLMGLVLISAIKVFKRVGSYDPIFTGLFAVWIAYQAQSIISLNQLGLAIWGWTISGLVIGYEVITRESIATKASLPYKGKTASMVTIMPATVLGMSFGFFVGLSLAIPPLNAAVKFKSGLKTGDATIVQSIASIWPQDAARSAQIGLILNQNKLSEEALAVLREAKIKFPDSYEVWKVFSAIPNKSAAEAEEVRAQMKRLDPLNRTLK